MTGIVDTDELGRRIRNLRLDLRLTLKQVEVASGLSATHISEIERGRTSPTIGALVRVSRALGKEAAYFIEEQERAEVAHHVREHVTTMAVGEGGTAEVLTPGIPGSALYSYRVRLRADPPGEWIVPDDSLEGDAVYLVQRGTLEARIGDGHWTVGEGDSLHATLEASHRLRASGGEVEFIVLTTRRVDGRRS